MRSVRMTQPGDLLISAATLRARRWVRNVRAERAAFDELAQISAADPQRTLQRLTDLVLHLYGAGSAGLSVLRPSSYGHADFVWEAVSGALAVHQGDGTPGDFSPCGLCLDTGTAIVLAHPERAFTYLARVQPAIFEALIAPLYDLHGTPLGALWVVHHEPTARFGTDDVLIIERLAPAMAVALKRTLAAYPPPIPDARSVSAGSAQPTSHRFGTHRTPGPARVN
jgi:GAF domain-containing protein